MVGRTRLAVVFLGLVVLASSLGFLSLQPDPEPTYAPNQLQGYNQTHNVTGAEAEAAITQIHQRPTNVAGFQKGIVADYGPEDMSPRIRLYVSVYNTSEMAGGNITRMVDRIRQSPMFVVENTTVESRTVYYADQEQIVYAFFSYRDAAYWVTYTKEADVSMESLVSEVIVRNRESRRAIPWP